MTVADTLFVNGSVFTAGMASSRPGAVAVTAGRIIAVGTDDEVTALRGPATEVVDLAGGLLLPGFQDAHVHPVGAGVDMLQCGQPGRCGRVGSTSLGLREVAGDGDCAGCSEPLSAHVGPGQAHDLVPVGHEAAHERAPDEPAATGDEDPHFHLPLIVRYQCIDVYVT